MGVIIGLNKTALADIILSLSSGVSINTFGRRIKHFLFEESMLCVYRRQMHKRGHEAKTRK